MTENITFNYVQCRFLLLFTLIRSRLKIKFYETIISYRVIITFLFYFYFDANFNLAIGLLIKHEFETLYENTI